VPAVTSKRDGGSGPPSARGSTFGLNHGTEGLDLLEASELW
jgi:hypothetical protein